MKFFRKLRRKKAEKGYEHLADTYLKIDELENSDKFIPFEVNREESIAYFIVPIVIAKGEDLNNTHITNEYSSIMMEGVMANSYYVPNKAPMVMVTSPNTYTRDLRIRGKILITGVTLLSNIYNFYLDLRKNCTDDIKKQVNMLYVKIPYCYAEDYIIIDHIQLYEYCSTDEDLFINQNIASILPDIVNISIDVIETKEEDFKIEGTSIVDHRTGNPRNVIYITYGFGSKICPCNVTILLDDLYYYCRDICKMYRLGNH